MSISSLESLLWIVSAICFAIGIFTKVALWNKTRKTSPDSKKETPVQLKKSETLAAVDKNKEEPKAGHAELKDDEIEERNILKEEPAPLKKLQEVAREAKRLKIGEILLHKSIITKEVLDKALEHREQHGGTITQYLLHYGYIDEKQLAQCLTEQFKVPYLPLDAYEISEETVNSIPVDIAEKYWVMPVDRQGNSLMVVMIDPLDTKIIRELEELTGLDIIPFVGIISEITSAIRSYYKVVAKAKGSTNMKLPPFFIDTKTYAGIERRHSIRYNTKINVRFPLGDNYRKSQTINVSRGGFAFESEDAMVLGLIVPLEINLPQEYSPLPITAVTQIIRCIPREDKKFEIGARTLKMSKQEIGIIISYAASHQEV